MKNGHDNVDGSVQPPPSKRIKLEEDVNEEVRLLSKKRKSSQRRGSKTTTEERALVLLSDDRISAVEPKQVLCRMCGNWVKLFKHTDFSPANWRTHADKCEPRSGWNARVRAEPGARFTLTIPPRKSAKPAPTEPPVTPIVPKPVKITLSAPAPKTVSSATRRPVKSTLERKHDLENDARVDVPGPHAVLCKICGQWVKMHNMREYDLWNWHRHAEKCELKNGWVRPDSGSGSGSGSATPLASTSGSGPEEAGIEVVNSADTSPVDELPRVELGVSLEERALNALVAPALNDDASTNELYELSENTPTQSESPIEAQQPPTAVAEHPSTAPIQSQSNAHGLPAPLPNSSTEDSASTATVINSDPHATQDLDQDRTWRDKNATISVDDLLTLSYPNGTPTDTPDARTHLFTEPSGMQAGADNPFRHIAPMPSSIFVKHEPEDSDNLLHPIEIMDETASTAHPPTKRKKGRSIDERRQALVDDPRTGEVEPHQVFCTICKKWIKLYKEVEYIESNWVRHVERCSIRFTNKKRQRAFNASLPIPTPLSDLPAKSASISTPSAPGPSKRGPVKTVEARLEDLKADSRILEIEPLQVLCGICGQWIKLQGYREYDIWNWKKHIPSCEVRYARAQQNEQAHQPQAVQPVQSPQSSQPPQPVQHPQPDQRPQAQSTNASRNVKLEEEMEAGPSSRPKVHVSAPPKYTSSSKAKDESTAEDRRDMLTQDGRCENIEPQRVTCKICSRTIGLHMKKDYSLSNWIRHISSCAKKASKTAQPTFKTPLTALKITRSAAASGAPSPSTLGAPTDNIALTTPISDIASPAPVNSPIDVDDFHQSSISAPASAGKMAKSTPEERKAKLMEDQRVGVLEPNRIQCKLCKHWLKLNEIMEYAPYNWYKHIERCEVRMSLNDQGTPDEPIVVKEEEPQVPEVKFMESTTAPTQWSSRRKSTPSERLERLRSDSRIKTIEKHRARCGLCDKWVKLQNKTEYDAHNWFTHIKKCALRSQAPSTSQQTPVHETPVSKLAKPDIVGRVDSDSLPGLVGGANDGDRRALLLNDPRCTSVEPHRVLCGICQQWIKLRDGKEYVPYNWFKHKSKCERRYGLPRSHVPPNADGLSLPSFVKKEPVAIDLNAIETADARKVTDEERQAQLRADPRLGGIEPGRVFCKMCNSWIKLNMTTGYLRGNWLRHAQRCKGVESWNGPLPLAAEAPELSSCEVIDLEVDNSGGGFFGSIELGDLVDSFEPTISSTDYGKPPQTKEPPAVVKKSAAWNMPTLRARTNTPTPQTYGYSEPKVSETGKRMHRSEEFRKEELENDPRTKIVQPDKIFCAMCERWIQMRRDVAYSPQNWLKHAGICEVRTGWLEKSKNQAEVKAVQELSRSASEEFVPYNARVHVDEEIEPTIPALTPVKWEAIISDSDEDDEDEADDVPIPVLVPAPSDSKSPAIQGGDVNPAKPSVQTNPLSSLRLAKVDATENPAPAVASPSTAAKRPPSKSPPVPHPFTTVPLHFYRPAFVQQSGFVSRDGVTSTSVHSQINPTHRPMPFVVPASSMLPHLLPRPVLVPMSQATGRRSAVPSPFLVPATPPLPPPAEKKAADSLPTPPPTGPGSNHIGSTSPVDHPVSTSSRASPAQAEGAAFEVKSPTIVTPPTNVAVPTPIRPVAGTNGVAAESNLIRPSPPPKTTKIVPYLPQQPGPVGPGVLQLAPPTSQSSQQPKKEEKPKANPPVLDLPANSSDVKLTLRADLEREQPSIQA